MLLVVLTSLVVSCTAALRLVTSHGPAIHSVKSRRLLLATVSRRYSSREDLCCAQATAATRTRARAR